MMDYNVYKDTREMSHEEWLESRKAGIGGSDAPAIVGLNPWSSRFQVYATKLGLIGPTEDNEAMRQGRDFEDYVAERFSEATGIKVRRRNAILQHPKYEWMLANVDRLVVGENAGLECKTTSVFNKTDFDNGNIPPYYYVQCQHYMAVTGADHWYVAVLVLNKSFHWFKVERNEEDIKALIEQEKMFWNENILKQVTPEPNENDSDLIKELYPTADEESEVPIHHIENRVEQLMDIKASIKNLEEVKKKLENIVKLELKDAVGGFGDRYIISYPTIESNRFNSRGFKKDHPDLYDKYANVSTYRRLTIKEAN